MCTGPYAALHTECMPARVQRLMRDNGFNPSFPINAAYVVPKGAQGEARCMFDYSMVVHLYTCSSSSS